MLQLVDITVLNSVTERTYRANTCQQVNQDPIYKASAKWIYNFCSLHKADLPDKEQSAGLQWLLRQDPQFKLGKLHQEIVLNYSRGAGKLALAEQGWTVEAVKNTLKTSEINDKTVWQQPNLVEALTVSIDGQPLSDIDYCRAVLAKRNHYYCVQRLFKLMIRNQTKVDLPFVKTFLKCGLLYTEMVSLNMVTKTVEVKPAHLDAFTRDSRSTLRY